MSRAVNNFEGLASAAGVAHEVTIEEREPIEALSDHWRFCDIVIFARRSLFDQGLVDEPVGTLNRMISLGIRPTIAAGAEAKPVRRAMAALSGSMVSAKVFKRYCQMKPWGRVPVDLLHIGEEDAETTSMMQRAASFAEGHGIEVGKQLIQPPLVQPSADAATRSNACSSD